MKDIKSYGIKSMMAHEHHLSGKMAHLAIDKVDSFYIRKNSGTNHPYDKMPPVRANVNCFFYITEGEVNVNIGANNYTIHKNDFVIIPTGQIFSITGFTNYTGYMGGFHNDFLISKFGGENILNEFEFLVFWNNPKINITDTVSETLSFILDRIYNEWQDESKDINIIRTYLLTMLLELNKIYKATIGAKQSSANKLTNMFKELILKGEYKKMGVSQYADILNVTPNHLNKTIKSVTGKSPSKWIDEAVVTEAKILLYQTTMSINEISAQIGIDDPSYFSRLFKKYEGVTPMEFRKMIEKS